MQRTFDNFAQWATAANGASEEALTRQVAMFVELLQAHPSGPSGYRLRRILLTNFWLYGQQEFEIPHGRLFLAGENASGKSTVLTAALPLALDGDMRPNRLDTFGGRERHIEYYVLGSNESATPFHYERRTAYIALEFEWCNPDAPPIAEELRLRWENGDREKTRFLTIGMSIAGNANITDRIRPLRFLITDGSRLGHDFDTVHETSDKKKRAYDHSRFKQVLEGHGIICETQAEYERQVARHLFGFADVKEFQKLVNLLLVLRRPNLSTELSFSRVHDYLKQSLRKISGETTSRVIGTIERIDAIQLEIEHIQQAYNATERLHQSRQHLALVRAQLAACDYMGAYLAERLVQNRVAKLRKDLFSADNERRRAEEQTQLLQVEQTQVSGQIKALEASEGLQVAQQLSSAHERVQEAEAQMRLQEQSLEAVRQAISASSESLERYWTQFEKMQMESATQLGELYTIAAGESYWEVAALQVEEALQQIKGISAEAPTSPEIPLAVTALMGTLTEERMTWLRSLETLHQQREQLETRVQYARIQETTRFQELDDSRRRFQAAQDRAYESQQSVAQALQPFVARRGSEEDALESFPAFGLPDLKGNGGGILIGARETGRDESGPYDDNELLSKNVLEQFASTLQGYRQTIDALERELIDAADQAQGELNELQLLTGSKNHEIAELNALYEQKLASPEYTPLRPTRHVLARAKLAEQGIDALPLYELLDFAPGIPSESEEAGRIEDILEDAGLLDALVVAPAQSIAADALLLAAGLSDCRLDLGEIRASAAEGRGVMSHGRSISASRPLGQNSARETNGESAEERDTSGHVLDTSALYGLCFDAELKSSETDWEATATTILLALRQRPAMGESSGAQTRARWATREDGTWTHGLLTGRAFGSVRSARCIGKATRLRVRQRELDALDVQRAQLAEELQYLTNQLANYEQQLAQLQEQQAQLRKVLTKSGMEERYAELVQTQGTLDEANGPRGRYQKARLQTQEARQGYNTLLARLVRESQGISAFVSESERVHTALIAVVKLKNQARSLSVQLGSLVHTWEEYQKAKQALERAKGNEGTVAQLYERVRHQALQAQAEEQELRSIAAFANAEQLSQRLSALRERNETLMVQLDEAKASFARADERVKNAEEHLTEAGDHLQQVNAESAEKQASFADLLVAYPVEALLETSEGDTISAAQWLLKRIVPAGETLREADIPQYKEHLEGAYREAYNALSRLFNHEQSLLHEYGPDLDDQGQVMFLYENKSRPVELLTILSERIEMQKTLLGEQERQLFEDFLLQEIAEAIRTHILEAEEWVQQINTVLSGLPMIGEHYSLQWKPPADYDLTKLGGNLAQQYRLLRKAAQTLTAEETETLMGAFRREIDSVRRLQQENADVSFMDALEQVFDYREWFHFDVWVTPIGGQRQRLTDRVAGTRSGAEQLFALYVPLFAALGALYRNAAPGAPRLLALDEAFDKVSVANTQRIIEFLVSQDFQWIMTGPQVSGTGTKIPACARYLMIHEKGSPIATASASFWSDNQLPTEGSLPSH